MEISETALTLVMHFEPLRLTASPDALGRWAVGYGHTGPGVRAGVHVTPTEAQELLVEDLYAAQTALASMLNVWLAQPAFDAFASVTADLGPEAVRTSKALASANGRQSRAAGAYFSRFAYANGRFVPKLYYRRRAERLLYETGALDLTREAA